MKKLLTFFLVSIFLSTLPAVEISEDINFFKCNSSDGVYTEITFDIPNYKISEIEENGKKYIKLSHPQAGKLLDFGKPELPVFGKLVALPDQGNPHLNITILEEEIINDVVVYPQQHLQTESSIEKPAFFQDDDSYLSDQPFPENIASATSPAIMRDFRVTNLSVCPFQYNAAKKTLKIIKKIQISVTVDSEIGDNPKKLSHSISRAFLPIYRSQIINFEFLTQRDDFQQPNYLFIYPNNSTVENYLSSLTDWKREKGFEVVSVSTSITGSSTASIKNYIQNAYDTWENPPENICLVGDAGGTYSIPTFTESWSGYGGEGDHPYTQLEGNDILADAIIGRLSFNTTTEFQTILSKILNYEKNPYLGNTNWFNNTLLVGDTAYGSGESCISTNLNIKEIISQSHPMMSYVEEYSSPFVSAISSGINTGCSYFNYRGWLGMSGWGNSNTEALNNGFMLPFSVIITCGTGSFEGTSDARSETFLKAGTPTVPRGAIAAIGTATTGTHTTFNNCVDVGIFDGLFRDMVQTPGAALVSGKLNIYQQFPDNPNNWVEISSYWNNLMGDPAIDLWSDVPEGLNISYTDPVGVGTNYLDIHISDDSGLSVKQAWVTFTTDDKFATGWTDSSGNVTLNIDVETADDGKITASKHNYIPEQETVTITQQSTLVNIINYQLDDDNSGSSSGNDDGVLNPGEIIELKLQMKNYGSSTANSVYGTLNDGFAHDVIDASESYGNIPTGTSVYSMDDFDFSVANDILGGKNIDLDISITSSNGGPWNDRLTFMVEGPNIEYDSQTIIDGNNSLLNPGESADLQITLENLGSLDLSNLTVVVNSSDSRLNFTDNQSIYSNIAAGSSADNSSDLFSVTADSQIIPGTQIPCLLYLTNPDGYNSRQEFFLNVGHVNSYDPIGPDDFGYYIYDDTDYQYYLAPIYSWVEIDGSGINLDFIDNGNNGDIETIPLPFNFRFYGINYSSITVCSNGWISFGETEQYDYMNWHVPGPMGASPMVAVFWDDLSMSSGDVYYYNDTTNHRVIVEWSEVRNHYDNSFETFQIILYNESYYPTDSNNGEMLLQYKDVSNVDQGDYPEYHGSHVSHGQFATVGIEDHTSYRGLEYTYDNDYAPAAKILTDETALFITTEEPEIVEPAEANFDANQFDISVEPASIHGSSLRISNAGEADLGFNISKNYINNRDNLIITRDSGGPDSYGYLWFDSNEPGGPEFQWEDISTYGDVESFTHNDNSSGTHPIGFTVDFYGTSYSSFRINPNGWIGFGDDSSAYSNSPLPDTGAPRPAIFPFWDDLFPLSNGGSGLVYYHSNSERLIVMFDNVRHWSSSTSTYTFEMILYADGKIKFQYLDMNETINSATIGIQDAAGNTALQMAYNTNYVEDNLAVMIYQAIDWLTVAPTTGSIPFSEHQDITLEIDSAELELGDYTCTLMISTNDPENQAVQIPVNLTVTDLVLNPPAITSVEYVDGTTPRLRISWEAVNGATYYNIYASDNPILPFDQWTQIASDITLTEWYGETDDGYKFYKVTAKN